MHFYKFRKCVLIKKKVPMRTIQCTFLRKRKQILRKPSSFVKIEKFTYCGTRLMEHLTFNLMVKHFKIEHSNTIRMFFSLRPKRSVVKTNFEPSLILNLMID